MNFYASQDAAKRSSGRLVFLFALAVISLIVITNLLVMFAFGFLAGQSDELSVSIDWGVFAAIGLGVTLIVLFGSLYKLNSLRAGGARVAEMMNGRLLQANSSDFLERRTLNIVEEMALASGTPVPPVYVLEESGINAFAAGYSPSDAVVGITRGSMEALSREELQGVIAHEFSHILHGDMRLNIRLIGVLHGILILGIVGYYLLRSGSRSRRSKEGGGIVILGLGLMVIGYAGTFFGNLIKAAVSRQREFLADASAVQFTRNPEGIGGALMQIGAHTAHSYMENPQSEEISHALFEEPRKSRFRGLTATHPPLEKRILAILPGWDGSFEQPRAQEQVEQQELAKGVDQPLGAEREALLGGTALLASEAVSSVGSLSPDGLRIAREMLENLPESVLQAARQPSSARALIYLIVLDHDERDRNAQLQQLSDSADPGVYDELALLLKLNWQAPPELRLPLAELTLPALRQLSPQQYDLFKKNFAALIAQDEKITLSEWTLQRFVFHHLDKVFSGLASKAYGKRDIRQCEGAIVTLLGAVCTAQRTEPAQRLAAFSEGASQLDLSVEFPEMAELSYKELNRALLELSDLKPLQKPALLKACSSCIMADEVVAPEEVDLLRTVAALLDCPMPPLTLQS